MKKMQTHEEVKRELLADEEVKAEYDRLEAEFSLRRAIIQLRKSSGMTQQAVAEKLGTRQSALSRLEAGRTNVSIGFLAKVAEVTGYELEVCFRPKGEDRGGKRIEAPIPAAGDRSQAKALGAA
ncbi:MAG: helix-turn-helix domain-containing protein [Chloroflexota bacterium]